MLRSGKLTEEPGSKERQSYSAILVVLDAHLLGEPVIGDQLGFRLATARAGRNTKTWWRALIRQTNDASFRTCVGSSIRSISAGSMTVFIGSRTG